MSHIDTVSLAFKMQKYDKIVFYGAGKCARWLQKELLKYNVEIDYFVVSKLGAKAENRTNRVPIYLFQDCVHKIQESNTIVVIAVSDIYEREIEINLKNNNINEYVFLSDYMYQEVQGNEEKNQLNNREEMLLRNTAEWYLVYSKKPYSELANTIEEWKKWIAEKRKNDNEVVLVVMYPMPRFLKIIKALHENNWRITILQCPEIVDLSGYVEKAKAYCDLYYECRCWEEVYYRLILSTAQVAHLFSPWGYSALSNNLIKNKKLFPKLVFETTDILAGMIAGVDKKWIESERYCLENADGVCCRGYELEYVKEYLGYKIKKDIIFMDYCNDNCMFSSPKDKEELSLCYVGGILFDDEGLVATNKIFFEIAKKCEENRCHLHIYPRDWDEKKYIDFIELNKESKYFHFHKPVPYWELSKELSKYDYSICPIKINFLDKKISGCQTKNKFIYATTNKFFDALDAGIPIIAAAPIKVLEVFEKEKVVLKRTIEEYDFDEMRKLKEELRKNVEKAHEKYVMKNKIGKLINFYHAVINEE